MKKKVIITIFIAILIVCCFLLFFFFFPKNQENTQEAQLKNEFKIGKIQYYSNSNAVKNNTSYQNPEWNLNLYQYTDIAIYLERLNEYSYDNYIKEISIDNININKLKKGTQSLFYLNPLNFGKDEFDIENTENEITENFEYSIVNLENEENDMTYTMPIVFEDLSNPITLKYLNYDIVKNYKIANTENITFNGSLLNMAKIDLEEIENYFSFNLNIITKNEKKHTILLNINIPLKNEEKTIYDGGIEFIENTKYEF